MVNSAGVNFGRPNEEFIIESDGNGALTSARNAVTGAEYVGGGGGDFSIAQLTLHYSGEHAVIAANIIDAGEQSCSNGLVEDGTFDIILYKGKAVLNWDTFDNLTINSGAAEIVEAGTVLITGNCVITVTA